MDLGAAYEVAGQGDGFGVASGAGDEVRFCPLGTENVGELAVDPRDDLLQVGFERIDKAIHDTVDFRQVRAVVASAVGVVKLFAVLVQSVQEDSFRSRFKERDVHRHFLGRKGHRPSELFELGLHADGEGRLGKSLQEVFKVQLDGTDELEALPHLAHEVPVEVLGLEVLLAIHANVSGLRLELKLGDVVSTEVIEAASQFEVGVFGQVIFQVQIAISYQHQRQRHEVVAHKDVARHMLHDNVVDLDAGHPGASQPGNDEEVFDVSSGGEQNHKVLVWHVVLKAVALLSSLQSVKPVKCELLRLRGVHGATLAYSIHRITAQQLLQPTRFRHVALRNGLTGRFGYEGAVRNRFVVKLEVHQLVSQRTGGFLGDEDGVFGMSGVQKIRFQNVHGSWGHGDGFAGVEREGRGGLYKTFFK